MSTSIRPRFLGCLAFALCALGCGDDETTGGGGSGASSASAGGGQGGEPDAGGGGAGGLGGSGAAGGEGGEGGAGGEPSMNDDFGGGTRLLAHYYDGGEGARQWISFVDSALESTQCSPGLAADGSLRCIPYAEAANVQYFADAGCTEPYIVTESQCGVPSYVSISLPQFDECTASHDGGATPAYRHQVFSVGESVTPKSQYWMVGDVCQEGPPVATSLAYHAIDTILSPAELAPMQAVVEPRDGGLSAEVMRADDGAFVVYGARTTDDGARCGVRDGRCYPSHTAATFLEDAYFTDAGCATEALVAQSTAGCGALTPDPSIALVGPSNGPLVAHELGAASSANTFFGGTPADCDEVNPMTADDMRFFSIGAPVDAASFPTVERANRGEGRLAVDVYQTPGGALLYPGQSFYDADLGGEYCQLAREASGGWRCVPGVFSSHNGFQFTDPACTAPFWYPSSVPANYYVELDYACGDLTVPSVVREVLPYDGPVYGFFGGECNAAGTLQGHAVGAVVGPQVFAAVTEVTE